MRTLSFTSAALALFFGASVALAQTASTTPPSPTFPIAELGNCASKSECKAYCDIEANKESCLSYAESHNLMHKAKVALARLLLKKEGPGGCTTKEACREFCSQEGNRDACFKFAVAHGLKSQEDSNREKNFQAALKTEGGPGGCKETKECKEYCSDPSHAAECRAFAELHGFNRLKNAMQGSTPMKFGSSTQPRPPKMGSTTRTLPFGEHPKGSTTAPRLDNRGPGSLNEGPGKGLQKFLPDFLRKGNRGPGSPNSGGGSVNSGKDGIEDEAEDTNDDQSFVPRTSIGAAVANFLQSLGL